VSYCLNFSARAQHAYTSILLYLIARFDVLRDGKQKFCTAIVSKVDFSGKVKRILFHYPKVLAKYDEWIEFGSERIARHNTKAPPPEPKGPKKKAGDKATKKGTKNSGKMNQIDSSGETPDDHKVNADSLLDDSPADSASSLDEKSFSIGGTCLRTFQLSGSECHAHTLISGSHSSL
jgi:hypothetical protein